MSLIADLGYTVVVTCATVFTVWPLAIVVGGNADDEDNWLGVFWLGVFLLLWVFLV